MKQILLGIALWIIAVAIAFVAWLFLIQMRLDPAWANAYTAFFTLILAITTGVLAFITWLNIHNASKREERQNNDRHLDEIKVWVKKGNNLFTSPFPTMQYAERQAAILHLDENLLYRQAYILRASKKLDSELNSQVAYVFPRLELLINNLNVEGEENEQMHEDYHTLYHECRELFHKMREHVSVVESKYIT